MQHSFYSAKTLTSYLVDDVVCFNQGDISRKSAILRNLTNALVGCKDTFEVSRRLGFSVNDEACKVFYNFVNYEKLAISLGEPHNPKTKARLANKSLELLSQNVGNFKISPF